MSNHQNQNTTTALYGYRYAPGSPVFELRGADRVTAAAAVCDRRSRQGKRGAAVTVELCRRTPDGWTYEPLTEAADRGTGQHDTGKTGDARQLLEDIPKLRQGRRRRPPRR